MKRKGYKETNTLFPFSLLILFRAKEKHLKQVEIFHKMQKINKSIRTIRKGFILCLFNEATPCAIIIPDIFCCFFLIFI